MAVSIDPSTKVINVPKTDLTLIQSNPTEIREMDLNWFRLTLMDLTDDADRIWMDTTHTHQPPVAIGGVTLARVVELINGYTVTFEDGQYAVNLVGGNSNVGDNVNVNQVSVRSANSAGLVQTDEIEFASFEGGVWIDVTSTTTGTIYPAGTARQPVNNISDAILIATNRGLRQFYILGNLTLDATAAVTDFIFVGESPTKTTITIDSAATTTNCEFYEAAITGTLDGECLVRECRILTLSYISGFIEGCVLEAGTITLGGGNAGHFLDCWSGAPGAGNPIVDCGGAGQALALRNYNGEIELQNKTGTEEISVDLNSGEITIDNTVSNGLVILRGIGKWANQDTYAGTATIVHELVESERIMRIAKLLTNKAITDPNTGKHTVYDDDSATVYLEADVFEDAAGSQPYRGQGAERREKLE